MDPDSDQSVSSIDTTRHIGRRVNLPRTLPHTSPPLRPQNWPDPGPAPRPPGPKPGRPSYVPGPHGQYARRAAASPDIKTAQTYLTEVENLIYILISHALESGMTHSQATELAVETFREVEVLARDEETGDLLPDHALFRVYSFCCSILASGTTFSSYEVAQRAIAAYRAMVRRLKLLWEEWDPEMIDGRIKARKSRRRVALLAQNLARMDGPESDADLERGDHEPE